MKPTAILKGLLFSSCIIMSISACLDQIDYNLPAEDLDFLAIQGRLVNSDPPVVSVVIKRVFGFESGESNVYVDSVKLYNDLGDSLRLVNTNLGVYEATITAMSGFEVETGQSFRIKVWTVDDRIYESSMETLHPVVAVDSITIQVIEDELGTNEDVDSKDRVKFFLNTPLRIAGQSERARVNWLMRRTFKISDAPIFQGVPSKTCYVSENLNIDEVEPIDGDLLNKDYLSDYELYEMNVDFKFQEGIYFNVFQQSLSKGAATYFTQVSKLSERTGNMFEGPVGELTSNFVNVNDPEDRVYGYFYATAIDTVHVGISPFKIYVPIPGRYCPPPFPPPPGSGCALEVCCDCLDVPESTTTEPSYWEL